MSILLPSLGAARERARRVKCASNLHQIALAWTMYLDYEMHGIFPKQLKNIQWFYGGKVDTVNFPQVLNPRPVNPYIGADPSGNRVAEVFHCPADRGVAYVGGPNKWRRPSTYDYYGNSYPANPRLFAHPQPWYEPVRLVDIRVPLPLVVLAGDHQHLDPGARNLEVFWHADDGLSVNLAFLDGHAEFLTLDPEREQTHRYSYVFEWLEPNDPNSP